MQETVTYSAKITVYAHFYSQAGKEHTPVPALQSTALLSAFLFGSSNPPVSTCNGTDTCPQTPSPAF